MDQCVRPRPQASGAGQRRWSRAPTPGTSPTSGVPIHLRHHGLGAQGWRARPQIDARIPWICDSDYQPQSGWARECQITPLPAECD